MRIYTPKKYNPIPKDARKVFTGIIYDVYHWKQTMFDDSTRTFEMLDRPDSVQIIAIVADKLIVLREKQPNTDWFLGLPGGMHDNHKENELEAAKRELLEETGLKFSNWALLRAHQKDPKINRIIYLMLATGPTGEPAPQKEQSGEVMEVKQMSYDEVLNLEGDESVRFLPFRILREAGSFEKLKDLAIFEY